MSFGFGVSDFIQVSNLAFKLYRRCRDSPKEYEHLASEVGNLRVVIDDVRLTVREHRLDEEQTEHVLGFGQSCLECLLDLETVLRRHQNLGSKARRAIERVGFDKDKIADIRQRLISNTNLLNAFNTSLTRSSTARIESLLRAFLDDQKAGRYEGTVLSIQTARSIKQGDDDWWKDVKEELEEAGITEEQMTENKKFISDWIIKAINSGELAEESVFSGSFHTAADGSVGANMSTTTTLLGKLPPDLDFPGTDFRWTRELVNSVDLLYKDAPEDFDELQLKLSHLKDIMVDVGGDVYEITTLSYHENLHRKLLMHPILTQLDGIMRDLADMEPDLKVPCSEDPDVVEWRQLPKHSEQLRNLCQDLEQRDHELSGVFQDLGTMVLCNLEDRLKNIMGEIREKQRAASVLSGWEELEAALVDGDEITTDDARRYQDAINSLLRVLLLDEQNMDGIELQQHVRNGSIGGSTSVSALPIRPLIAKSQHSMAGSLSQVKSRSSVTDSDQMSLERPSGMLGLKPKRLSVLFVDLNNTTRSPIAKAWLESLMAQHPILAAHFSRVSSAGLSASKPGVPLVPGVDFLLRDYNIAENFVHISRRLERRDVEKYEYTLTMNVGQRDDILSRWQPRAELEEHETTPAKHFSREDIERRVFLLGSFGQEGNQDREVPTPDHIDGHYWFQVGTRRIYPGYERCLSDIKAYIADFIYKATGFDVHAQALSESQELDSREGSPETSGDEDYSDVYQASHWPSAEEPAGIEELTRVISQYQENVAAAAPHEADTLQSAIDSPIMVTIKADQQQRETDEEVLHMHHEQFHRLVTLLLTDIGDSSLSSLRQSVLDWEEDGNRNILAVNAGHVQWVLEKSTGEQADICNLCASTGSKSGFVRDARLEVIAEAEADVIARYLELAIQVASQRPTVSSDEAKVLEQIRDAPRRGPVGPPSIRDDVSVSVRNDRPRLDHEIAKIRKRDAESKIGKAGGSQQERAGHFTSATPPPPRLMRRETASSNIADTTRERREDDVPEAGAVSRTNTNLNLTRPATPKGSPTRAVKSGTRTPGRRTTKFFASLEQISIMFLGSTHLHGAIMAEVYLASLTGKNLALACRVRDVVSAGVEKIKPDQKLNPRKLERLFKNQDLLPFWPQKPERLLLPEDVIDFNHILILDSAPAGAPYRSWEEDNPDEAESMKEKATAQGLDWKANFKCTIEKLRKFDDAHRQGEPLMDPVRPENGEDNIFGVRMAAFEKHMVRIQKAVDRFLLMELGYDVTRKKFTTDKTQH